MTEQIRRLLNDKLWTVERTFLIGALPFLEESVVVELPRGVSSSRTMAFLKNLDR